LNKNHFDKTVIPLRLTALWALSEAALGGVLHIFRLPFTGLIVGSVAVVLISMIAYYSENPFKAIVKALMTVLIIKAMVSPHSPIPAYLAVGFQGLVGALLFSFLPSFRIAALILGVVALLESALQKLITLTLIFGKPLWDSIDVFIKYVLKAISIDEEVITTSGSYWLVGAYLTLYCIVGFIAGYLAGVFPTKVKDASNNLEPVDFKLDYYENNLNKSVKKPFWKRKKWRLFAGIILLMTLVHFFMPIENKSSQVFYYLLRVVAVLSIWYLILAPIVL